MTVFDNWCDYSANTGNCTGCRACKREYSKGFCLGEGYRVEIKQVKTDNYWIVSYYHYGKVHTHYGVRKPSKATIRLIGNRVFKDNVDWRMVDEY